ncbi:hypothetical protein CXIVA_04980 [Clostridium sp. SY8519]|uniref:hypothetical protein n=1 Tax=Clostridium sp. (strain SY8519) TaxID=1042156 RepID=UPI0002171BB2|nr:hypothetical protein [Clostridium sp. SY8519]BAK46465.1 hypothetical protein CXIVA_04980 [Clostridium sp. SY8519]
MEASLLAEEMLLPFLCGDSRVFAGLEETGEVARSDMYFRSSVFLYGIGFLFIYQVIISQINSFPMNETAAINLYIYFWLDTDAKKVQVTDVIYVGRDQSRQLENMPLKD